MKFQSIFLLLSLCLFPLFLSAQQQRFRAGLTLGWNAAQLDGDNHFGYHKFGLEGGLRGAAILHDRLDLVVELLFSQRGSKGSGGSSNNTANIKKPVNISLNYAEAPILLHFKVGENWDGYYSFHLLGGLSYGRLLNSKVTETVFNPNNELEVMYGELENDFQRNHLSAILGISWLVRPQIAISLRHVFALTPLHRGRADLPGRPRLQSYYLNLSLGYWF
ncbi:MAG: porin family protein [Bacteroidota bacterium]